MESVGMFEVRPRLTLGCSSWLGFLAALPVFVDAAMEAAGVVGHDQPRPTAWPDTIRCRIPGARLATGPALGDPRRQARGGGDGRLGGALPAMTHGCRDGGMLARIPATID